LPAERASLKEAVMYVKIIAAMLAIAVMAGCNTMAGAGKDVQSVGSSLENSAEKNKNK
jgi:predicted small secreted protein